MSRVLGVIPARAAATRFPGKPLALLRGRPLVEHVWRRAGAATTLGRLVVATDDDAIAAAVRAFGGEVVRTSSDHLSGTDRVAEAARLLPGYDVVVNIQGDEPLLSPVAIDAAVEPVASTSHLRPGEPHAGHPVVPEMATLAHVEHAVEAFLSLDVVKVVTNPGGYAVYFSRAPLGARPGVDGTPQPPPAGFLRHVGLYVYRAEALQQIARLPVTPLELAERLEQLRPLQFGFRICVVVTPYTSRGVDTPSDLAALERDWEAPGGGAGSGEKESPR